MLSKLLKYEIKATSRMFLPMYAALLVFAVINRFLFSSTVQRPVNSFDLQAIVSVISMVIYITLIAGVMIMTLIVMIQRFYKSLLGDEGYLMFTLPVQTWKHIFNKLIVSMMWFVLSGIIAVCSILTVANVQEADFDLSEAFDFFSRYFGVVGSLEMIVSVLLSVAGSILMIYAAIALGHQFSKHKILASFGMYIVINTVMQVLMSILMVAFGTMNLGPSFNEPTILQVQLFALYLMIYLAATAAGCFVLTNFILKRKLNLE